MPAAAKLLNLRGFLAKIETTYGTLNAPSGATDAILSLEDPEVTVGYAHDGTRNNDAMTLARVARSGRFGTLSLITEAAGFGAAYSASNFPNIHTALRIAGMSATGSFVGGSEKWTYAPQVDSTTFSSASIEAYYRIQKYALQGVYASGFKVTADGPTVPKWEFPMSGILTLPVDSTEAAIAGFTYPTILPAKADNLTINLGAFTTNAIVKGFEFECKADISPRLQDNSGGSNAHAGFARGKPIVTCMTSVEATALVGSPFNSAAGLDPYNLAEQETEVAFQLKAGSVQYKRWTIAATKAQIIDVAESKQGNTAMWDIKWAFHPTTVYGVDYFSLVFD
jgi:hypothetical protein